MASLGSITMPKSKLREAVLKILSSEKYVGKVTSDDQGLTVELLYKSKTPVITEIVRVSKPGSRVYMGFKSLRLVLGGMGIQILSTPKGIMTGSQARKLKVGGEVICKVW